MITNFSIRNLFVATLALFASVSLNAAEPATAFKFQFGAEKAASGYTLVPPSLQYSKENGYGFEPGANLMNVTGKAFTALHRGAVTSSRPFFFSVNVPQGNYRVTVTLGDPKADAVTTVEGGVAPAHARAHPHARRANLKPARSR
jgi:fibronectin type 3 domain-containing protein